MSDLDKPITVKHVAIGGGCLAGALAIGAALMGLLYVMACANMPTGCH